MPPWCDYGYRVIIAVGILTIAFAVGVPVWLKIRGAIDLIDAATGAMGRATLAGAAAGWAILMFHDGAPYHVPCGGLGVDLVTGLLSS